MTRSRPLSVALVGAGPAGIYAADILSKSGLDVSIDLFERLPAPFGLVRYGVAPDHPRIKQIIVALHRILQRGDINLIGNVEIGADVSLAQLREHYDAVVVSTGSDRDAALNIPGVELSGSFGAADFVSWYDGHPDVPRTWPLEAQEVAVIGAGNVALDVARMLAKHVEDLMPTEIPANVAEQLAANPVTDVHVFGRRGPAQAKFTPLELRELGHVPDVDVVVYEEDFQFDEASEDMIRSNNQAKQVVKTLMDWTLREESERTASRRIHLHFLHRPVEVLGGDRVEGIRTERTELTGDGSVRGTGEFVDTPVQAVYRAVGYFGSPVPGLPFDVAGGVIPNTEGRVLGEDGEPIPGVYATGWIKRGPVGLIGSTKSDARETIGHLVEDAEAGLLRATGRDDDAVGHDAMLAALEEGGVRYTTWQGWELLDAYEQALGAQHEGVERNRVKVVRRETMTAISRGEEHDGALL
ncbi:FAD-dependent oxidoreductase [Georgenia sp. 10Sc9-8]|uniref:ferredoxin--NADP(+) reductase n=1 Tax=Georgenia halotolerans TaxID=3028317 RepID=A0ABT5TV92_9MICO|nr:FAD-dependent oxidoreductase [Georgenia halotolerans]